MSPQTDTKPKWALASYALNDAYTDFILSRQAILCSPRTLSWYTFTLGKVIDWLVENGVKAPDEIQARHIRAYLSGMAKRGMSDSYINNHARVKDKGEDLLEHFVPYFDHRSFLKFEIEFRIPYSMDWHTVKAVFDFAPQANYPPPSEKGTGISHPRLIQHLHKLKTPTYWLLLRVEANKYFKAMQ